ncbi:MAG: response regulator [Ardenticatenaceae bacterium]|nr:response regulator [Ardenticatenaceae bacterium]MCB8986126.1 response regulator [Ardenticatenaceae bacterium]
MADQTIRIILADDHELVRAGIRNALKDVANLEVVSEVGSGVELMQALDLLDADLLIMDINMPGFEPLSEIHSIRTRYPALRILIVSAYDDDIYVQGLLSAGANGYHLKDQPLSDLKLAIERILTGKRWVSSPLLEKLLSPQVNMPVLSKRQVDIAQCLTNGLGNREIALQLHLSIKTVENHLTRLYNQLHVTNRLEALAYLYEHPEILALPAQVAAQDSVFTRDYLVAERTRILIVDDNKRYRKQLSRLVGIAQSQAMIYEASDIQEALHIAEKVTPHLVFVDVVLGNEDGISCTRRLHLKVPSARIVLISAYPDREFHRRGLEAGAAAFVDKKDMDMATLRQIIEDAIG